METLRFESLPLNEVVLRLASGSPMRFEYAHLQKATHLLAHAMPEVLAFEARLSSPVPFRLTVGGEVSLHLRGPQSELKVNQHEVLVFWHAGLQEGYPRFASLIGAMRQVLEAVEADAFTLANMTYVNKVNSAAWHEYIAPLSAPFLLAPKLKELNVAFESLNGLDYRIQAQSIGIDNEDMSSILATTCGKFLNGGSPTLALEHVHTELIEMFPMVISEKAKREWGYDVSSS